MTHALPRRSAIRRLPALSALSALSAACLAIATLPAMASSHREAPSITLAPKIDGTDFYLFNSYEGGRGDYVTLIANYQPLQDPYGGPNYFKMDPNALYEIHIDNNGDAKEDLTFQFRFQNLFKAIALPIGNQMVPIPLTQAGQVGAPNAAALNVNEKFTLNLVRGDRRTGQVAAITNAANGSASFDKPVDNIGVKTIPTYASYAAQHIHSASIPGCAMPARVFVGQRQEAFAVNLGVIFDLVNAPVGVITDPALINAAAGNSIQGKNVTTLALEVHKSCLTQGAEPVIGGWTTASVRQSQIVNANPPAGHQTATSHGGAWVQVSRLGMPLVNEVVIGLPDKDRFNAGGAEQGRQLCHLCDAPDAAGAAGDCAEPARHCADQSAAPGPGDDLPDRHCRCQPAGQCGGRGDAAPEHRHSRGAVRDAEPAGHRRQHPGRRQRQRRLPERPPAQGRCGRHLAGRRDGRPVHGQWQWQCAGLWRRLQAVCRAAGRDRVPPARRGGPGRGAAAARLPLPEHAERGARSEPRPASQPENLPMKKLPFLLAAFCLAGSAQAAVLTFDDPGVVEIDNGVATYTEAGFAISGLAASFLPIDQRLVGGFDATPFSLMLAGGGSFSLRSLDHDFFDLGFGGAGSELTITGCGVASRWPA